MEREHAAGKRGGAVSVEEEQAAPITEEEGCTSKRGGAAAEGVEEIAETEELISPETLVHTSSTNMTIFDLYEVGHEKVTRQICKDKGTEIPFAHQIKIHGPQGEIVRVSALFDGAAMVAAMCVSLFNLVKHRLGTWEPSQRHLRMANGVIVPSLARWEGTIQLKNVTVKGSFEVFDSGGSWAFLLGKPLLRQFGACQNFGSDTVEIKANDGSVTTLQNELNIPKAFEPAVEGVSLTLDVKQVFVTTTDETTDSILTRETEPFKPERVARILQEVTIGPDVTASQRDEISKLISEYADCFALAIKEVNAIPNAVHKLNIPEGATFKTKIPPRSYNPEDRKSVV